MKITTRSYNGHCLLKIADRIEVRTDLTPLRSAFADCLVDGATRVAVSFTRDTYLYSSLIAEMVIFLNQLRGHDGSLAIVHPNPHMVKLLDQFGIAKLVQVTATEEEIHDDA